MKVNLKELDSLVEQDYLSCQKHPNLNLLIWNYTPKTQFSRHWDKYTEVCRGLITDLEGNIIARPFKKFFNYGEDSLLTIPASKPVVSEKMDGSLGIQYYDGDKVCIATRGSFSSDQANWATHYINTVCRFIKNDFKEGFTYLYEIIYPENRIVVDYKSRAEVVLLAVINTENGDETFIDVETEARRLNLSWAPRIKDVTMEQVIKMTQSLSGNEEGFVFHWPRENNLRLKIKGKEYVRLHKLLTEFSTISIWEILKEQEDLTKVLTQVPDEFYDWVKQTQTELMNQYAELVERAKLGWLDVVALPTRKEQAQKVFAQYGDIASYIFAMLDSKDPSKLIWKSLRPRYEKPFAKDIEI